MTLKPRSVSEYHVFLASPGDMSQERQEIRASSSNTTAHGHRWGSALL